MYKTVKKNFKIWVKISWSH